MADPTSLARVYQARAQYLGVHEKYLSAHITWVIASTSDSEGLRAQAGDLFATASMLHDTLIGPCLRELREATREAQVAGLLP